MTARTDRLNAAIRAIAFAQRAAADEWVAGSGLTRQQGFALGYIEAHQARGVIARELAEMSGTTPASVTSLLQGLEDRGLITRAPSPTDSRVKLVSITPAGARIIAGFDTEMAAAQEKIFAPLTTSDQDLLADLLERIVAGNDLAEFPAPPRRDSR